MRKSARICAHTSANLLYLSGEKNNVMRPHDTCVLCFQFPPAEPQAACATTSLSMETVVVESPPNAVARLQC
jgi:hypothetical protein